MNEDEVRHTRRTISPEALRYAAVDVVAYTELAVRQDLGRPDVECRWLAEICRGPDGIWRRVPWTPGERVPDGTRLLICSARTDRLQKGAGPDHSSTTDTPPEG